jgi:hypothetical protein
VDLGRLHLQRQLRIGIGFGIDAVPSARIHEREAQIVGNLGKMDGQQTHHKPVKNLRRHEPVINGPFTLPASGPSTDPYFGEKDKDMMPLSDDDTAED